MHVSKLAPHFGTLSSFPHAGFSFRLETEGDMMIVPHHVDEQGDIVYKVAVGDGDVEYQDLFVGQKAGPMTRQPKSSNLRWPENVHAVTQREMPEVLKDLGTIHAGILKLAQLAPQKPLAKVLEIIQDFGSTHGSRTDTLTNPELKALVEA